VVAIEFEKSTFVVKENILDYTLNAKQLGEHFV
jgi:hypothetical protein